MTFLSSKWPGTATFPPIVVAHYDELLQPRRERTVSLHYEALTYGRAGLKSIMEILEKLPQSDRASGLISHPLSLLQNGLNPPIAPGVGELACKLEVPAMDGKQVQCARSWEGIRTILTRFLRCWTQSVERAASSTPDGFSASHPSTPVAAEVEPPSSSSSLGNQAKVDDPDWLSWSEDEGENEEDDSDEAGDLQEEQKFYPGMVFRDREVARFAFMQLSR